MVLEECLACPVCKSTLRLTDDSTLVCSACNRLFPILNDVPVLLPDELSEFKRLEADYHTLAVDQYSAVNMADSLRVRKYHDDFLKPLESMTPGAFVLEVAGGDGSDALQLQMRGMRVIQTDISIGMVSIAKKKLLSINSSGFVVCDAENLPCKDNKLDAILIVAGLHHLSSPSAFFAEAKRALKPGGLLVIGFEPNTWQYTFVYPALKMIRRFVSYKDKVFPSSASIADQEAQGFSMKHFKDFAASSELEIKEVQRIWYINGFVHTVLCHINARREGLSPIEIPNLMQHALIFLDTIISKIPLLRNFCWHWSVVLRK